VKARFLIGYDVTTGKHVGEISDVQKLAFNKIFDGDREAYTVVKHIIDGNTPADIRTLYKSEAATTEYHTFLGQLIMDGDVSPAELMYSKVDFAHILESVKEDGEITEASLKKILDVDEHDLTNILSIPVENKKYMEQIKVWKYENFRNNGGTHNKQQSACPKN
jgi:hypothetical protein